MPERGFDPDPGSVARARAFAAATLASIDTGLLDRVLLLVSELASNSVRHAAAPFVVGIDRDDEGVRVSVRDEGGGRPRLRHPAPSEPSGRGLQIVAALSDGWGVDTDAPGGGTCVWFVIRTGTVGRPDDARESVDSGRGGRRDAVTDR